MALLFGAATTDRVVVTDVAAIRTLSAWTLIELVNPNTFTSNRTLGSKSTGATVGWFLQHSDGLGNLGLTVARATTNTNYISNSAPLVLGVPKYVAVTFDSAATPAVHIYVADVSGAFAEVAYGTTTDGTGAVNSDSGSDVFIGNRTNASPTRAFQGLIANAVFVKGALSLGQCNEWKRTLRLIPSTLFYHEYGVNGTGQHPDLAGNRNFGTVTGATVIGHPYRTPYQPQVDEWWQGYDSYGPWQPNRRLGFVAAGSFTLAAAQGSYVVTGKAAALLRSSRVAANQGSYAISGQAAGLLVAHRIVAGQGTYAVSGQAATFRWNHVLTAVKGSYAVSGQAATLIYSGAGAFVFRMGQTWLSPSERSGTLLLNERTGLATPTGRSGTLTPGAFS